MWFLPFQQCNLMLPKTMLINNIDELTAIVPTVTGGDFSIYSQALLESERWLMNSALGELSDKIETDELLSTKCKEIVAYRAYKGVIPKLDLINTGNGFAVVNDTKLAPASRDRVNALVESISQSLINALNDLCEYLEDNHSEQWIDSPGTTIIPDTLIPTLREFSKYSHFVGNYDNWRTLKPSHQIVMRRFIHPAVSAELTDKLISLEDSAPDCYRNLLEDVKYAFAAYLGDHQDIGNQLIASVRSFLIEHPNDFPEYKNSKQYQPIKAVESRSGLGIFM